MSVRAKFFVESVTGYAGGASTVRMSPVLAGSEENKSFWQATPSGSLEMFINNRKAVAFFEAGREYYIDFTQVATGDSVYSNSLGLCLTKGYRIPPSSI